MKAGAASQQINHKTGAQMQGAGIKHQPIKGIRDDLEANALFLKSGEHELLFVSCDVIAFENDYVHRYKKAIAETCGIDTTRIIIGCSHTHGAPVIQRTSYYKPVDEVYLERLSQWLCEVSKKAITSAQPAQFGWGHGKARLGYNRRVCYDDNTHNMFRKHGQDEHVTGIEGPDDTDCLAVGIFNEQGKLQAVLHHGTGHPASSYGTNELTADYPGIARRIVREAYGSVPVLFFNGALGDIAMHQQAHPQLTEDSPKIQTTRLGTELAGETLRLLHEMVPQKELTIRHVRKELELPVQLPDAKQLKQAKSVFAKMEAGEDVHGMDAIFAWGPILLDQRFGEKPVDCISFHALQLNDLVIITHPFELYCQYQIDIKRRSPVPYTACFGITDGYGGYMPTLAATVGGGYSSTPFDWARFSAESGCKTVDFVAQMLHEIWKPL